MCQVTHLEVPISVLQIELSTCLISSCYLCELLCQLLACLPVWYITACLIWLTHIWIFLREQLVRNCQEVGKQRSNKINIGVPFLGAQAKMQNSEH